MNFTRGVEQSDVDHQAEVDDGEHEERGRGRHGLHGVHHHVADAEARSGEKAEDCGGTMISASTGVNFLVMIRTMNTAIIANPSKTSTAGSLLL